MTPLVHDRLLIWGFSLAYLAMLGSLVVWVNPFLEDFRSLIVVTGLLPIGLVGILLVAAAKLSERS